MAPWPNFGRGLGTTPRRRNAAFHANWPRQTTTRTRGSNASSLTAHGRQVSRSSVVGLLAGGAQRTAASIQASMSSRPSSRSTDVGWLAKPARCRAAKRKSPERSPVKMRPVRLPPCAAGARPRMMTRASGSPKPGIGRPQYSSPANDARLTRATSSRQATRRGQRRHSTTCASSSARLLEDAKDQALDDRLEVADVARAAEADLSRGELGDRRDQREGVLDRLQPRRAEPLVRAAVLLVDGLREGLHDRVAALHRPRAGADDLDEQRLGERRMLGDRADVGPQPRADARFRLVGPGLRRLGHPREDELGGLVEEREDRLLLVGEMLVERRLGHPR